jgi:hypothetical protein
LNQVVPFLYSSEIFPLVNREVGMSFSCSINFLLAGVLALTVPPLSHSLGPTRLLCLFAGLDACAAILVWLLVPGTKRAVSLEEFNYIFGVPVWRHIQYQVQTVLPYIWNDYLHWFFKFYLPWLFSFKRREVGTGDSGGEDNMDDTPFEVGGVIEEKYPWSKLEPLNDLYTWTSVRSMNL